MVVWMVVGVVAAPSSTSSGAIDSDFGQRDFGEKDFGDHMHCSLCMSFCFSLQRAMLASQPGPSMAAAKARKFLAADDRVEAVLAEAVLQSTRDYTWVDETPGLNNAVPKGRFWHYDVLKMQKEELTDEVWRL